MTVNINHEWCASSLGYLDTIRRDRDSNEYLPLAVFNLEPLRNQLEVHQIN